MDSKTQHPACIPESIVGPLPSHAESFLDSYAMDSPHMKYDLEYLSYMTKNHGGIPKSPWFQTEQGEVHSIARFTNFGGPFTPPFQESYDDLDLRDCWNIDYLIEFGNINDGCGAYLIPFAVTDYAPDDHNGMMLTDLLCFDFSDPRADQPRVVFWHNQRAQDEYAACHNAGRDSHTELDHGKFTQFVAGNFGELLDLLVGDREQIT